MRNILTFSGAGWDIITVTDPNVRDTTRIWNIVDGVAYPFLSWKPGTLLRTPIITTTTLPAGTVGTAYDQTLAATGDTPLTWSLAGGALPDGLSLSAAGVISGTPTAAGTFDFTVQATNAAGTDTQALNIVINPAADVSVTGVTVAPTTATINAGVTQQLTAAVAPANATNQAVTWASSDTAVATVSPTGLVTGVAAGNATITVTTVDGGHTATSALTVVDQPAGAVVTGRVDLPGRADDSGVMVSIAGTALSATSLADGSFTLSGVPSGQQTLVFTKGLFLVRMLIVDVPATGTLPLLQPVTLRPGDANNDNRVNLQDLTLLATAYRTKTGELRFNANADFNADGHVNIQDLTLLAGSYRAVGDTI
jgi:hypothetical protein